MAINPNYFANVSGIGPQTGGFNPTPADTISSAFRQNSTNGLLEYSLYSSPRVRGFSGLLATGLAGDPAQAAKLLNNTGQGQLLKDVSALAVAAGLIPGGNPVQLAAGVQQMVGTQGFTVGGNFGRNSPVFGGGQITDGMSRTIFDAIKGNFYDKVTELPKRSAHGMNMNQMAEAMGQLTARGAFSGMDIGELNMDNLGKLNFKLDKQKMEKVNKTFSDYAGMLKDARKIFGDLPIADLTQNAERLIGTSLREMGSVSAMRNRMASIQATSAAYSLNPAAVATRMMDMTDSVQASMYAKAMQDPRISRDPHMQAILSTAFGRNAADISHASVLGGISAADTATATSNAYAAQGIYMPTIGNEEASRALAGMMQEMQTGRDSEAFGNVLATRHMISTGKIKNPALVAKLNDLMTKTMTAGSVQQSVELNQQIATTLAESGINIDNYKMGRTDAEMKRELDTASSAKHSKEFEQATRRRLIEEGTIEMNMREEDFGLFSGTEIGIKNREMFSDFAGNVNKKSQDALLAAVGPDGKIDEKKLNEVYANTPMLAEAMSKDKFREMITSFSRDPAREKGKVTDQISAMATTMHRGGRLAVAGNEQDRLMAEERAVISYLSSTSLGDGVNQESLGTELMRGFFGTGKIDNQVVLASLKNKGQLASFTQKAGLKGLDLNEESLGKLSDSIGVEQMANVAAELGIDPSDKKALAAALGTRKGFAVLQRNLGTAAMGVNSDGTVSFASGAALEKETKNLETQAMMTAAKNLFGVDKKIGGDLTTEEGRAQYNKDVMSELTKGGGAKISELSGKFGKTGIYGGADFEALVSLSESNPEIRRAIRDSAASARAEGTEDGKRKYTELRRLDMELGAASGEGGSKFLGVLEIMTDSLAQLKLFQESGG
jgi:hypothetical protein